MPATLIQNQNLFQKVAGIIFIKMKMIEIS